MSDDPWKVTSLCNNGHKKSRKGRHGIYYICGDHCLQKALTGFPRFQEQDYGMRTLIDTIEKIGRSAA